MRKLIAGIAVMATLIFGVPKQASAETDEERFYFLNAVAAQNWYCGEGAQDACESLIRLVWGDDADWAMRIVWRESRFTAAARNPSGASGLFQLMLPLHRGLFYAVDCTPEDWHNALCNIKAARHLYNGAGARPWAL